MEDTTNEPQAKYWNSPSGRKWVEFEEQLDVVLEAVNDALIERARPKPGEPILDIGCGTGATTRAVARHLGAGATITAVDISETLLGRARERHAEISGTIAYECADAQSARLAAAPFDLVISRFGVMFFSDPVAAFANIRSMMRPGGRFVVAGWAAAALNPYFMIPLKAAIERLGPPGQSDPNAPGPLGFQNIEHVVPILEAAGFAEIKAEAAEITLRHPGSAGALATLAVNVGPVARIVHRYEGGQNDIEAITKTVEAEVRQYETPDGIGIPATINIFSGVNPERD